MPQSLPLCLDPCSHWGNDFIEVAPASVYLGEMILDVTLIMYAAVDAGFAEETKTHGNNLARRIGHRICRDTLDR